MSRKQPFADTEYYTENGFGESSPKLPGLLGRASRIMRAEAQHVGISLDHEISEGRLDAALAADVCCDMAAYALASPGGVGVESTQQGAGPYQETIKYVNPVGQLSLTRVHRKRLGLPGSRAWSIDLTKGRHEHRR